MARIKIKEGEANVTPSQIADLYKNAGFGDLSFLLKSGAIDMLFGSNIYWVYAINEVTNELVGSIRLFSDNVVVTYIVEICVLPQYRSMGIGEELMDYATKKFNHTSLYCCGFRGMERFFLEYGLSEKDKLFACSRKAFYEGSCIKNRH